MSLVGSLEDLGLGDILQIVSLSRKSGLLLLRSEEGEGRIVFCDGLVRAAFVKGAAEDLKGLLLTGGFLDEDAFQRAADRADSLGDPIVDVLADTAQLTREHIDSLRREHVERSVFAMFGWGAGEFSFEIRDDIEDRDRELMLPTGVNAQYLAMEAMRIGDEGDPGGDPDDIEFGTVEEGANLGADERLPAAAPCDGDAAEAVALAAARGAGVPELDAEDEGFASAAAPDGAGALVTPVEIAVAEDNGADPAAVAVSAETEVAAVPEAVAAEDVEATPDDPAPVEFGSLILMDPDLTALEWQKSMLGPLFKRIHVFQRIDGGISRLRQYLRRGVHPIVLVSDSFGADPMNGIRDPAGLIGRLRAHARQLPIFLVQSGDGPPPTGVGLAVQRLLRPPNHQLANRRGWPRLEAAGEALREGVTLGARMVSQAPPEESDGSAVGAARDPAEDLRRLKHTSNRLRDPSAQGEVLALILEFAAKAFERVAIFMVREEQAIGMVQSGLAAAGGPGDREFQEIAVPAGEPAWFRVVLESRDGVKAPPTNDADRALALRLGSRAPAEAYVAAIESSHHVVALVYVDNLPSGAPIRETAALDIVLHEAGLALERALLERALADASH